MSQPRRSMLHDFRIGELLMLSVPVAPIEARRVVQVVGFRGDGLLRLLPIGGVPLLASYELVDRVGLPCGSPRPPHRRPYRRPRRKQQQPQAA